MSPEPDEPGHLFVVMSDLTTLAVHAVIVPCDSRLNIHVGFQSFFQKPTRPGTLSDRQYRRPAEASAAAVADHPGLWAMDDAIDPDHPRVFLLETSNEHGDLDAVLGRMARAIRHITSAARSGEPERRPLIGLTLPGIHAGGFAHRYSEAIGKTLHHLAQIIAEPDGPDLVIVTQRQADYAALQHVRKGAGPELMPELSRAEWTDALSVAAELGRRAIAGDLTLFLGAGASAGSGLPGWQDLLLELAQDDPELQDAIRNRQIELIDVAAIIERDGLPQDFRQHVARQLDSRRFSMVHALLAGMRIPEAITTNFDRSYESASGRVSVLPRRGTSWERPWLLKMHGDVDNPDSIILSRDDYMRFDRENSPTSSIVQSRMMTSHMLFVGYSITDENVVRLARQVQHYRYSHGADGSEPIGTVLGLRVDPLKARLWSDVLRFVSLPSHGDAARDVLVFLDHLAMLTSNDVGFLLDDKYAGLLSADDTRIKQAVRDLQLARQSASPSDDVRAVVDGFLRSLGG